MKRGSRDSPGNKGTEPPSPGRLRNSSHSICGDGRGLGETTKGCGPRVGMEKPGSGQGHPHLEGPSLGTSLHPCIPWHRKRQAGDRLARPRAERASPLSGHPKSGSVSRH